MADHVGCLSYIQYANPSILIYPFSSPFPCGNHKCFLSLWVCFSFVNKFICIIIFDTTYLRGCHYFYYLHPSLVSGQTTGREHSPAYQQKIGLKIYWAWPCPTEQDLVSPSQSLPSGSFHKLLSWSTRGQTEWKSQSQKTNQNDHMDHSLV